jgi:hypothetical protein
MLDPISAPLRPSFLAPGFHPARPRPARPSWPAVLGILLFGCLGAFAGCNADHPLRPAGGELESVATPAPASPLALTLVYEMRGEVSTRPLGQLTRPADIDAAIRALPPFDRQALADRGSCVTQDAAFRAVVLELLGHGPDARGVSGHLNHSSWGRIKAHYLP